MAWIDGVGSCIFSGLVISQNKPLSMPSNRTVSKTGEKTVKIRTTGNEKNRLTVVLTCAGDGSKLKPLVLLYFALKMFRFVALMTIGITIFFLESVLKNRVRIIYGCALYTVNNFLVA